MRYQRNLYTAEKCI